MAKFKLIDKDMEGVYVFKCPGCNMEHTVNTNASYSDKVWSFNGNFDKPTVTPSVKNTFPANPDATDEYKQWRTERICHCIITDGMIEFCTDSFHHLSGTKVEIPDYQ